MNSRRLVALGAVAVCAFMTGCSDEGSHAPGEPLPAPMATPEAENPGAQEEADDPTFAAFDADANRIVDESEWQNKEARSMVELKNMTFHQIDRDSSGGIDPDEFANARTDVGLNANTNDTVRDSAAEPAEATGP